MLRAVAASRKTDKPLGSATTSGMAVEEWAEWRGSKDFSADLIICSFTSINKSSVDFITTQNRVGISKEDLIL
jgi:hypothetical protein